MSIISLPFMQRFMGNLDTAIRRYVDNRLVEKQDVPTMLSRTMIAGETSVTFTGLPTTGVNKITICTSQMGLNYTGLDDSTAGQITVTFDALESPVTVYVLIEGYNV